MTRGYKTKKGIDGRLHEVRVIVVDHVKKSLRREGRVCIERFGCFEVVSMKKRLFKNNNGKISVVPAYNKISFRPSLSFKKYINERKVA